MNSTDTTVIQTLVAHLVQVYRNHGVDTFHRELMVYLDHIREHTSDDPREAAAQLLRLGIRLYRELGVPGDASGNREARLMEVLVRSASVERMMESYRIALLRGLGIDVTTGPAWAAQHALSGRVREYLRTCATITLRTLTVDILAERHGVSRSYLSRSYRHVFGHGIGEAIRSERLNRAFAMLSDPANTMTVQDIAISVGYWNTHRFRQAFHCRFGFMPGHVRRPETGG